MRLKLFRATGYSTLLMPGEVRTSPHPGWLVLAVSLWVGLACNVALWRQVAGSPLAAGWSATLLLAAFVTGAGICVLSLLAWRRTLKLAATVWLVAGAIVACGLWVQAVPTDATLWSSHARNLLPGWAALLRWQVPLLLAALAVLPVLAVWNLGLRRLPGPRQLRANLLGALVGAALTFASGFYLLP